MIDLVSAALRSLLTDAASRDEGVDVSFDAPTRKWAAGRTAPTVNVYLYDVREDRSVRKEGQVPVTDTDTGRVTARRRPARYYRLSYLVTAWTHRPEDEHRLLARVLETALLDDRLPPACLGPELAALGLPLPLFVGQAPSDDRSVPDVWTALGGDLKPSIDLAVGMPVLPGRARAAGPPVREELEARVLRKAGAPGPAPAEPSAPPPAMRRRRRSGADLLTEGR